MHVETGIEPPGLPQSPDEPDDEPRVGAQLLLVEPDDTRRFHLVSIPADVATDDQLADALIACLRGVAASRGPGLTAAVERRIW